MRDNSGVKYFHRDYLGSATLTTDTNGTPAYQTRFDLYGTETLASGLDASDYGFIPRRAQASQRLESGFGLVAVGTVVTVFVPQAGFQSLTNMFWVIIGVAEAMVVRTRLLKQGDVTQTTDKSAIAIVIFLLI